MKEKIKKIVVDAAIVLAFTAIGMGFILWGTSAEVWYAGEHTQGCELLDGEETCTCYERLLKADKEKQNELERKRK